MNGTARTLYAKHSLSHSKNTYIESVPSLPDFQGALRAIHNLSLPWGEGKRLRPEYLAFLCQKCFALITRSDVLNLQVMMCLQPSHLLSACLAKIR